MKYLLLFPLILSAACSCPPPRVITSPEIGSDLKVFWDLCGPIADNTNTVIQSYSYDANGNLTNLTISAGSGALKAGSCG